MAAKKIISVLGATGAQGGGLVRAILDDPDSGFTVRAITRTVDSDAARALAKRGAEVVAGDVDDEESLVRAFSGAHGVYGVTFYWAHMDPARETEEGRRIARAARTAGVPHVIWSTFEDTRKRVPLDDTRMPTLMGHYKVPHFDSKAEANAAFAGAGVPTTYLLTSFYWDNLIHFGMGPTMGPDGVLGFTMPMGAAKLPGIAAGDIGGCAYGIFKRGNEYVGKTVGIAGEHLSGAEMAAALGRALHTTVRFNDVTPDTYRGFGFPGADDLGNMFQYKRDFEREYRAVRDVARSRALNPKLQTFDQWLAANASLIPHD
jgi:uncharacterized protein YbjT (DUF2867 family)